MLPSAVCLAVDEANRLPVVVDRRALVVDEPRVEPDLLHGCEVEGGLELRRLLRPGDTEEVGWGERLLQRGDPACELAAARGEEDDDLGARLGAELLRERRRVDLLS